MSDELSMLKRVVHVQRRALEELLDGQGDKEKWGYIGADPLTVIKLVEVAVNKIKRNFSFLEVGCSFGLNMQLVFDKFYPSSANYKVKRVHALEIDKKAIKASRCVYNNRDVFEIIYQDALKFDDYDQYDIIYTWQPTKDSYDTKPETKFRTLLFNKIYAEMKVGAILISYDGPWGTLPKTFKKVRVSADTNGYGQIYIKGEE